ncbi:hypothetical protein SIN8267_01537 [Sinobacterium norvegicum]|uniref:Uncharacterized protein n=1 Tax=Sinobacterium norvegicum TaxID=1641715 RepID=A0ABM9AEC2_9GAMM|nr:DUF5993 family protein [Sinobacterium norvegicum]CAH0991431.1 hypothetical protein SIN8267_01537 [Sinobacterium norvegicum]
MMALLFSLFFAAMVCSVIGQRQAALTSGYVALIASSFWLLHHSTDALSILL